jgi:dolichol-phosphate mannosyltransferase
MTAPLLSVVVPVLNEQDNIVPLIGEITAALRGRHAFEIVYVDDGSTDKTAEVLVQQMAQVPELRVVRHAQRTGQSFAVRSGVKAAQGVWIGTLDGDGQNDPADLPKLLDMALAGGEGLALVGGWRTKRKDTIWKKIGSKIGNGVRQFFLRDNCADSGCGIKVYRRDAFLDLPAFNALHRFTPALMISRGWQCAYVPVNHRPRERGVSKYNNLQRALVGIVDLMGVAWLRNRARIVKSSLMSR